MRGIQKKWISLLVALLGCLCMQAQTYEDLWRQVEEAQRQGLLRTASRRVNQISKKATRERNFPQSLRADLMRIAHQQELQPNSFFANIRRMEHWMKQCREPADRKVLQLVVGSMYMTQCNRLSRATAAELTKAPDDLSLWTGAMFQQRALDYFTEVLSDMDFLAHVDARTYEPLVLTGDDSPYFHHDLLSVTASLILDWVGRRDVAYTNDLYKRLVDYYEEADNREAVALIKFRQMCYWYWNGEDSSDNSDAARRVRYYRRAKALLDDYRDAACIPRIYEELISTSELPSDTLFRWAQDALARYPHYKRHAVYRNAFDQLTLPCLNVFVDGVLTYGTPLRYEVNYRNIDGLRMELYEADTGRPVCRDSLTLQAGTGRSMAYHDTLAAFPPLGPGHYKARFFYAGQRLDATFRVARMNVYGRSLPDGSIQVFVLDRSSGHPVEGAEVECLSAHETRWKNGRGRIRTGWDYRPWCRLTTDERGSVVIDADCPYEVVGVTARKEAYGQTDTLRLHKPGRQAERQTEDCELFTDRAIYRPGQDVRFAGIAFATRGERARVLPAQEMKVYLYAPSYKKPLDSLTVATNEFGTFSGAFPLPAKALPGRWSVRVLSKAMASFQVENYRLPTFKVELERPTDTYALGDSVCLRGQAVTYAGVPLARAHVHYSVTRMLGRWLGTSGFLSRDTVVQGVATTDSLGCFKLPARLKDVDSRSRNGWCITYCLKAEVTASGGETQTGFRLLHVGSRSLLLRASMPADWVKERLEPVGLEAENLSGEPVEAEGECVFLRIKELAYPLDSVRGDSVLALPFSTRQPLRVSDVRDLPSGRYCLEFRTKDGQGRPVVVRESMTLFSLKDKHIPVDGLGWYYADVHKLGTGRESTVLVGTSARDAYLLYDVYTKDSLLESGHYLVSDSILTFRYKDRPEYKDGIGISWFMVKDNEEFSGEVLIPREVPRELTLKWKTFRDRLCPGQKEEWQLQVTDAEGRPAEAELLATLYDASLDKFSKLRWKLYWFDWFRIDAMNMNHNIESLKALRFEFPTPVCKVPDWHEMYWDAVLWQKKTTLPRKEDGALTEVSLRLHDKGYNPYDRGYQVFNMVEQISPFQALKGMRDDIGQDGAPLTSVRSDFSESAFFEPSLCTNWKGRVTLKFTLPESMTTWRFLGLAHTKDMQSGLLEGEAVASKDFMLQQYVPRYVRAGDRTVLTARLTSRLHEPVDGTVRMELFNPVTEAVLLREEQPFTLEPGGQSACSFVCCIPDTCRLLACRMVAESGQFSDGEQRRLPVRSAKEEVLEAFSFMVDSVGRQTYRLDSLFHGAGRHDVGRKLTVEWAHDPGWIAVSALPVLMEPARDDALSLASAYYACCLGSWMLAHVPSLRERLQAWVDEQSTDSVGDSAERQAAWEETPWKENVLDASERRARLALLLDSVRLRKQAIYYLGRLGQLQDCEGGIAWMKDWPAYRTMTIAVIEVLERLTRLTGETFVDDYHFLVDRSLDYLSQSLKREAKRFKKWEQDTGRKMFAYEVELHDLYVRTLWGQPLTGELAEAVDYFYRRMKELPDKLTIYGRAAAAQIAWRRGDRDVARVFWQSLLESSVTDSRLGRYYATPAVTSLWGDLRLPTQVMVLEAGRMLGEEESVLAPFRQWLLQQKQVQAWANPYYTATAIYALLEGEDLWTDKPMEVGLSLGGIPLKVSSRGCAPGYAKAEAWLDAGEETPEELLVEVPAGRKVGGTVSVEYQTEAVAVTSAGNDLRIERTFLVSQRDEPDTQWSEWNGKDTLRVGDRLRSCVTVQARRTVDFVQLTDCLAVCLEPADWKSGFVWNGDVQSYRAVRDDSVCHYLSRLEEETYRWETDYVVSHTGTYRLGMASVQSVYAPGVHAHTGTVVVHVGD